VNPATVLAAVVTIPTEVVGELRVCVADFGPTLDRRVGTVQPETIEGRGLGVGPKRGVSFRGACVLFSRAVAAYSARVPWTNHPV